MKSRKMIMDETCTSSNTDAAAYDQVYGYIVGGIGPHPAGTRSPPVERPADASTTNWVTEAAR